MANRRMIAKRITSNSAFLRMHAQAQALYLHLSAECDDDGIADATILRRMTGFRVSALQELIDNGFVIEEQQGNGIVWLADWQGYNTYQNDRTTPSIHRNNIATSICNSNNPLISKKSRDFWKQFVSEGKSISEEIREEDKRQVKADTSAPAPAPSFSEVEKYYKAYCEEYGYEYRQGFVERFLSYKHPEYWQGDIDKWVRQDQEKQKNRKPSKTFQNFESSETDYDALFYKACVNNPI